MKTNKLFIFLLLIIYSLININSIVKGDEPQANTIILYVSNSNNNYIVGGECGLNYNNTCNSIKDAVSYYNSITTIGNESNKLVIQLYSPAYDYSYYSVYSNSINDFNGNNIEIIGYDGSLSSSFIITSPENSDVPFINFKNTNNNNKRSSIQVTLTGISFNGNFDNLFNNEIIGSTLNIKTCQFTGKFGSYYIKNYGDINIVNSNIQSMNCNGLYCFSLFKSQYGKIESRNSNFQEINNSTEILETYGSIVVSNCNFNSIISGLLSLSTLVDIDYSTFKKFDGYYSFINLVGDLFPQQDNPKLNIKNSYFIDINQGIFLNNRGISNISNSYLNFNGGFSLNENKLTITDSQVISNNYVTMSASNSMLSVKNSFISNNGNSYVISANGNSFIQIVGNTFNETSKISCSGNSSMIFMENKNLDDPLLTCQSCGLLLIDTKRYCLSDQYPSNSISLFNNLSISLISILLLLSSSLLL